MQAYVFQRKSERRKNWFKKVLTFTHEVGLNVQKYRNYNAVERRPDVRFWEDKLI